MAPRLKRIANALMTCIAATWIGYQALHGEGGLRITSIALLIVGAVTAVGVILDHVPPRPKRRRSREEREVG
ncbi:hypothetical protein [Streptomyces sp. NPDC001536]|uniref:hypothetical protein n=1 Tax=Streptomyces sp. NPDC001536 TaxID=3364583 RepID=UPI0036775E01